MSKNKSLKAKLYRFVIILFIVMIAPIAISFIPSNEIPKELRFVYKALVDFRKQIVSRVEDEINIANDGNINDSEIIFIEDDELLELPLNDGNVIYHKAYSLKYSEEHEQASWVAYHLTKKEVLCKMKRTDDFREDPAISTGSATLKDYRGSGYDRGHLSPAADNRWSKEVMSESFYMSNMSPQHPSLNRGIWKKLEEKVRDWAVDNEELYIVTGPIFQEGTEYKTIGPNSVTVPDYYYKVILDYKKPSIKAIGFIFPNQKCSGGLEKYAQPINLVEKYTQIDFFNKLDDEIEERLESENNLNEWR